MIPSADFAAHAARVARDISHIYCTSNLYIVGVSAHVAHAARVFKTFVLNNFKSFILNFSVTILRF